MPEPRKSIEREDKQLSPHFLLSEFRCKCAACAGLLPSFIDPHLVGMLEAVRQHFGRPVHINSGFRCLPHNRAVGSNEYSQHVVGRAADIVVERVDPATVAEFCEKVAVKNRGGVGRYTTFCHVDARGKRARWHG